MIRLRMAPVTCTTAHRHARIAAALRAKGRRIPANDIRIAAHGLETGADLPSADRRFAELDGRAWMPLEGDAR